jgi:hypothetical protein
MGFGKRAAEDGEILREDIDHAAIDRAPACHHAIACGALCLHAEIGAAVGDEHVEFFEGAFIQQQVDAFARGQLALGVLRVDAALASAHAGRVATCFKLLQNIFHRRNPPVCRRRIAAETGYGKRNLVNMQIQCSDTIANCKSAKYPPDAVCCGRDCHRWQSLCLQGRSGLGFRAAAIRTNGSAQTGRGAAVWTAGGFAKPAERRLATLLR